MPVVSSLRIYSVDVTDFQIFANNIKELLLSYLQNNNLLVPDGRESIKEIAIVIREANKGWLGSWIDRIFKDENNKDGELKYVIVRVVPPKES